MKKMIFTLMLGIAFPGIALAQNVSADTATSAATSANAQNSNNVFQQLNRANVTELQSALIAKGYLKGSADGLYGPKTAAAVTRFQADNNIANSGTINQETLNQLGISIGAAANNNTAVQTDTQASGTQNMDGRSAGSSVGTRAGMNAASQSNTSLGAQTSTSGNTGLTDTNAGAGMQTGAEVRSDTNMRSGATLGAGTVVRSDGETIAPTMPERTVRDERIENNNDASGGLRAESQTNTSVGVGGAGVGANVGVGANTGIGIGSGVGVGTDARGSARTTTNAGNQ